MYNVWPRVDQFMYMDRINSGTEVSNVSIKAILKFK